MAVNTSNDHGKRFDAFCWNCRTSVNSDFDYTCKSCRRSFHYSCNKPETKKHNFKLMTVDISNPECPVCNEISLSRMNFENRPNYLTVVNFAIYIAIDNLKSKDTERIFWEPVDQKQFFTYNKYVANPMDFRTMQTKCCQLSYSSPREFLYDAHLILHNCFLFNASIKFYKSQASMIYDAAYEHYCYIDYCVECYLSNWKNTNQSERSVFVPNFMSHCYRPHGIVWAKEEPELPGKFLPAKILKYCEKKKTVDLCFFGSRKLLSDISIGKCYLLSQKRPSSCSSHATNSAPDSKAMAELNRFLEGIQFFEGDKQITNKSANKRLDELLYQPVDTVLTDKFLHMFENIDKKFDLNNKDIFSMDSFKKFKSRIGQTVDRIDEIFDETNNNNNGVMDVDGDSPVVVAASATTTTNSNFTPIPFKMPRHHSTPTASSSASTSQPNRSNRQQNRISSLATTPTSTSANFETNFESFLKDYSQKLGKQYLDYQETTKVYRHNEMKLKEQEKSLLDYYRQLQVQVYKKDVTKFVSYCQVCLSNKANPSYRCCFRHIYCSKECRAKDWPTHQANCTREEEQKYCVLSKDH